MILKFNNNNNKMYKVKKQATVAGYISWPEIKEELIVIWYPYQKDFWTLILPRNEVGRVVHFFKSFVICNFLISGIWFV